MLGKHTTGEPTYHQMTDDKKQPKPLGRPPLRRDHISEVALVGDIEEQMIAVALDMTGFGYSDYHIVGSISRKFGVDKPEARKAVKEARHVMRSTKDEDPSDKIARYEYQLDQAYIEACRITGPDGLHARTQLMKLKGEALGFGKNGSTLTINNANNGVVPDSVVFGSDFLEAFDEARMAHENGKPVVLQTTEVRVTVNKDTDTTEEDTLNNEDLSDTELQSDQ